MAFQSDQTGSVETEFEAALTLHRQGRLPEAERGYRTILKAAPRHSRALQNLGIIQASRGKLDDAARLLREAATHSPDSADIHDNLGVVLENAHRFEEAIDSYRRAIELSPNYAEAHHHLGNAMRALGRHEQAVSCFERVLELEPARTGALSNLGISLHALGRHVDALACFERAAAGGSPNAEAHNNLGVALQALDRHAEAVPQFERALALKPSYVEAQYNLGNSLYFLERFAEAARSCERVISMRPSHVKAHNNLGNCLFAMGRHEAAITHFRRASKLNPADGSPYWNEGLAHLALGNFDLGWKNYEHRWGVILEKRDFSQPLWLGETNIAGKTILLHAEQGFGDTMQFCRYAPLVRERGAAVVLEVQPELVKLIRGSFAESGITIVARGGELPRFDLHCPLMSLPLACGTLLETVPATIPYLRADPARREQSLAWLKDAAPAGPRIGLVWAVNIQTPGSNGRRTDARRSLPLSTYRKFFEIDGLNFVSLQVGQDPTQIAPSRLLGPPGELRTFADTAALVANLDLVVTVDTSVAHLAGAMGRPVWILTRFDGCWRWLLEREDTPWYPTTRLFRQPTLGAWGPVVARIESDLRRLAAGDQAILQPRAFPT